MGEAGFLRKGGEDGKSKYSAVIPPMAGNLPVTFNALEGASSVENRPERNLDLPEAIGKRNEETDTNEETGSKEDKPGEKETNPDDSVPVPASTGKPEGPDKVPTEVTLVSKDDPPGDEGDSKEDECRAAQVTLCDTGKPFGGKRCTKKVKESVSLLIEDRLLQEDGFAPTPPFDAPLEVKFCGLHSKKYQDRLRELACTLEQCFGRGFSCSYGDLVLKYCHLHMAKALEDEVKRKHQELGGKSAEQIEGMEFEDVWKAPSGKLIRPPLRETMPVVGDGNMMREESVEKNVRKRRLSMDSLESNTRYPKASEGGAHTNERMSVCLNDWESFHLPTAELNFPPVEKHVAPSLSANPRIGGPDSVFARFAAPGMEEDSTRSAEIEVSMPNFVRRPREKPTFIPVDMQMDYEAGSKKKEPWEIVAEGIGDMRNSTEEKDLEGITRIVEFTVFALRGFGCFRVELGIGAFGKELSDTLRRQASVM